VVMEDGGGEYGVGAADFEAVVQVFQGTHAAGGDDRHRYGVGDGANEFEIEAGFGTVAIHAGDQQFAGAVVGHFMRPFQGVDTGGAAAAMGEYFPARRFALGGDVARVDGDDAALPAVALGGIAHQFRILDGGAVDGDFAGAGLQQPAHVLQGAYAATDGQRDEYRPGHAFDQFDQRFAAFLGGGDVEKDQVVGALLVVSTGAVDRIAGVLDVDEAHTLDHM